MTNTTRHDGHFLKAKKIRANSKLLINSRSKEFVLYLVFFFNNVSVIEACIFCKEGLEPN
jgi:hypothetical protein